SSGVASGDDLAPGSLGELLDLQWGRLVQTPMAPDLPNPHPIGVVDATGSAGNGLRHALDVLIEGGHRSAAGHAPHELFASHARQELVGCDAHAGEQDTDRLQLGGYRSVGIGRHGVASMGITAWWVRSIACSAAMVYATRRSRPGQAMRSKRSPASRRHACRTEAGSRRYPWRVIVYGPSWSGTITTAPSRTDMATGSPGRHRRICSGDRSASRPRSSIGVTTQYANGVWPGATRLASGSPRAGGGDDRRSDIRADQS